MCGTCWESGRGECPHDGAALVPSYTPRVLATRYRLDRRLGRGGFGTVYAAFDSALRRLDEAAYVERLEDRIRSRRVVFAAVLQMMRGHGLSETEAFKLIRQTAMRRRTTIEQLSADIIAVGGMPNRTTRTA